MEKRIKELTAMFKYKDDNNNEDHGLNPNSEMS